MTVYNNNPTVALWPAVWSDGTREKQRSQCFCPPAEDSLCPWAWLRGWALSGGKYSSGQRRAQHLRGSSSFCVNTFLSVAGPEMLLKKHLNPV